MYNPEILYLCAVGFVFKRPKIEKKIEKMEKRVQRLYATSEQRRAILKAFGIKRAHLSNVLYYRRNSDRDKRIREFAKLIGAREQVVVTIIEENR